MSELAFNINGEAFDVPPSATGWRVRRMKHKGPPEVVYGRDGVPLVLGIDAQLDDLKGQVGTAGRYRLDPIDGNKSIPDGQPAYVYVNAEPTPASMPRNSGPIAAPATTESVVIEAMRMNAEIAKSVVDRFPMMLEAASSLLRAADGAGLPARLPRMLESGEVLDDAEDEAPAPPTGFDLNAIVAQLVPLVITSLMNGKLKVPGLGDMLDWRKAAAKAPKQQATHVNPAAIAADDIAGDPAPAVEPMFPPLDPDTITHFMAIQSALKPEEAAVARAVAADLAPLELRAWFDDLKKLSVPDGVAKIRGLISKKGGAS